jgi:hypothetical protein
MKEVLEAVTRYSAVVSVLVLTLAIAHEWAFFFFVGREVQALMNATDYLFSALYWLPPAIAISLISIFLSELPNLLTDASPPPSRSSKGMIATFVLLLFLFIVTIVGLDIYNGAWIIYAGLLILFAFIFVVVREVTRGRITVSMPIFATCFVLILGLTWSIQSGVTDGRAALTKTSGVYIVRLKDEPNDNERHLVLLRNLNTGILVRDVLVRRILYYKWDQIVYLGRRDDVPTMVPLICRVIPYYPDCPPAPVLM